MPNPIYNLMNKNKQPDMELAFMNFMNGMRGQDPDAIINDMVQSGRISQEQLSQIQTKAKQMEKFFSKFAGRFGF